MTIYDQVEKLLDSQSDRPKWADEILYELKEIKTILKEIRKTRAKPYRDKAYFDFVDMLRKKMRADIANEKYPEIDYHGRKLGINFKGWIYDKETTKSLPAHEAFEVYRYLYARRDNLDKFVTNMIQ